MQLDLKNIATIFKRNILILLFVPLITVALTWQINEMSTAVYETTASILINMKPAEGEEVDPNMVASYQKLVETYAQLLKSKTVYEAAGEKLGLDQEKIKSLAGTINVTSKELMQIITIKVRAADSQLAQNFLVSLIEATQQVGTEKIGVNMIQIVDAPELPTTPVSPNKTVNLITGATVGIVLAVFLAFLRDYLDTRIYEAEQLMKLSGYPLLGKIPIMKGTNSFVSDKKIRGGEAYRVLRIKVQSLAEAQQVKSILITSAVNGEGKTQVLVNLGDLLAKSGKKVLIIDGNIRQPKVHTFFGLENTQGLTTLLQSEEVLENFEIQTSREGVDVLLAGPIVEHPDELLGSEYFTRILNEVKINYDFILIDSASLLMYSDTIGLIKKVDATIMVSRAHKIKVGQLKKAQQYLVELGGNVLGIIANQFPTKNK